MDKNLIIQIIIVFIGMILFNIWIFRRIEKANDNIVRSLYVITFIISDVFLTIYYFDRLGIPTMLGLNVGVDSKEWLTIITSCASSIISATIGGLIAFGIARNQINESNKQSQENNRIQNMPLLKYEISAVNLYNIIDSCQLIKNDSEKGTLASYDLFIYIKNIGQNNVKRVIVDFESPIFETMQRVLGSDTMIPIEKNEIKGIKTYFSLKDKKEYKFKLNIYYEDVLQNWYFQTVEINYNITSTKNEEFTEVKINYDVNEEELIKLKNIPKYK